jgi:hypothetical protein
MPDRSRLAHALGAAALSLALLVMPTAARAQGPDREVPVPAGAPAVLSTADGSGLIVFSSGSSLCFAVQEPGAERPRAVPASGLTGGGGEAGGCQAVPVLTPFAGDVRGQLQVGDAPAVLLVTGTGVAAVEAKRDGRVLARAYTAATGLPGAAADVRVALLPLPAARATATAVDDVALLDAGGAVRAAIAPDLSLFEDPSGAPARTLTRGGRGVTAWRLGTYRKRVLAPTPLLPERLVTVSCLALTAGDTTDRECDDPALASRAVVPSPGQSCAPLGRSMAVLARAPVRRVVLILGDGTRRAIPLRAVPGDAGHLRAGVAFVGEGVAIRRLVALGAGGTLQSDPVRLAPAATPRCGRHDGSGVGTSSTIVEDQSAFPPLRTPGPHVFHAADSGPDLCLAVDRTPHLSGADCGIPPTDAAATFLRYAPAAVAGATTLYGLVPADVTVVRLRLDDGSTREVPATPIPGYAGQYAATTLLVDAEVAAPRHIAGYQLRDGRGRVLQDQDYGPASAPALSRATTVLRTPGLPPLRAALLTGSQAIGTFPCLALGALDSLVDCTLAGPGTYLARAFCAPRRIVIWGVLSHASDDLVAQTAGGREIVARKAVLPDAIRRGKGTTAALLVLPADVGLRRLVLRGKAAGKTDLVLPPAARQCGYDSFAWITSALPSNE